MEAFFIYILKSSVVLGIFFLAYQLLLKRETFFTSNRHFLLGGLLAALILPLVVFTKYVYVEASFTPITAATEFTTVAQEILPPLVRGPEIDWWNVLLTVYIIGVAAMVFRMLLQFISLQKLFKNFPKQQLGKLTYIEVAGEISPFSFFNHIIYNPSMYATNELQAIIEHEQAHCRQLHSLDMILSELFLAFQWCNPLAWLYKSSVQQNLEYIADNEATSSVVSVKNYQRTMLKVSLKNYCTAITNNFFNSLIKKRIIMINQHPSKRRNQWKFLAVVPLLALFLVSFNTKEVTKLIEPSTKTTSQPSFISPIGAANIKRISTGFEIKMNPFSKKKEFHKGVDLIANPRTPVVATAHGVVNIAGNDDSKGNYVVIEHKDGYGSKYFHLKNHTVTKGQKVTAGDIIGYVGNTGLSTGTHLHFEILKDANAIDPQHILPFLNKVSKGKVFIISPKATNAELATITNEFNEKTDEVDIQIGGIARSGNGQLIKLYFKTKFKGQKEFIKRFSFDGKVKAFEELTFSYNPEKKGIDLSHGDNMETLIKADIVSNIFPKIKLSEKDKPDLHTNVNYTEKDHPISTNTLLVASQSSQSFKIRISKEMSDTALKALKKKVKKTYGYDLKYSKLKRNSENMITSISVELTDGDSNVNGSYSNQDGIPDINIGKSAEGGMYMTSGGMHEHLGIHTIEKEGNDNEHKNNTKVHIHTGENGEGTKTWSKKSDKGYIYLTGDLDEALILKDNKEISKDEMEALDPANIRSISVLEDEAAIKKHGKRAKNGVIEIITKKE